MIDASLKPVHEVQGRHRQHSLNERIADGTVHALGLGAGVVGVFALFAHVRDLALLPPLLIYAFGLLAMLAASAAYNIFYETRFRGKLRKLDHAAIFLMIAGTYTPLIAISFDTALALTLNAVIWSVAIGGICLKFLNEKIFARLSLGLYLALGWCAVVILVPHLIISAPELLLPLALGGLLYTGGVVFYLWKNLPFHNAVWHGFVLMAAACHYWAVIEGTQHWALTG